jgi:hypothetical protein
MRVGFLQDFFIGAFHIAPQSGQRFGLIAFEDVNGFDDRLHKIFDQIGIFCSGLSQRDHTRIRVNNPELIGSKVERKWL